jgi:voltage-gated potassium channel
VYKKLKQVIEQNDTVPGKVFDITIQILILISLVSFSLETLPNLSIGIRSLLRLIEVITVIIFTIEYILRLLVADKKLRFIFSFSGLIDLAAILPFYVARGIDLRAIRVLRLLRIMRAFKFLRYNTAIERFKNAFVMIRNELILFTFTTIFLLFITSVGIYYFENPAQPEVYSSIFSSMWWSVATLTTVGYGDIYPITVGGKIFTSIMLFIGLGIVAVPAGLIASALTNTIRSSDGEKNI